MIIVTKRTTSYILTFIYLYIFYFFYFVCFPSLAMQAAILNPLKESSDIECAVLTLNDIFLQESIK